MRYLIRGKFTAQALRTIQQQGMVDRVERAKERFREMGAEIKQAYLVPTAGVLELVAICEAEEEALAAILFAINGNGLPKRWTKSLRGVAPYPYRRDDLVIVAGTSAILYVSPWFVR